jgi:hypothetical protein
MKRNCVCGGVVETLLIIAAVGTAICGSCKGGGK